MSELRFNELRGEEVAYAIHRQDRTFLPDRDHCPLDATPPGGAPTEIPLPAFEIVVFDNRFPAFESPAGAAEVVVYTDDHDGSFGALAPERAEALMWVWRHRYEELGAREDIDYVYIFENRGVEIGVTLHHPHGQIYGYPFLPPVPALELAADARLGGCAPCRLLELEQADGRRLVSVALQRLVRGYDALFSRPMPYVMAVHQAPTAAGGHEGHLHVEFYPPLRSADKLKYPAGSEQGAGTFISDVLPEDAAAALREAIALGA